MRNVVNKHWLLGIVGFGVLFPVIASSETYWGFTASRDANPNTTGIYWNHTTDDDGDLQVVAAVLNHESNVIETATFDENGELIHGANTNGEESITEYIERTEGGSDDTASGYYGGTDPYNCDFNCDPNGGFGTPDDFFGGG